MSADELLPRNILEAYGASGAPVEELSGGRSNRTMRVGTPHELIVQRVRAAPASDLLSVMENIVRVTSHLDWGQRMSPDPVVRSQPTWWPELVPTRAGKPFVMDDDGTVWRAFSYRPGRIARGPQSAATLLSAARLFGRFSKGTAGLDDPPLLESTVGFHDLDLVWQSFVDEFDAARGGGGGGGADQPYRLSGASRAVGGPDRADHTNGAMERRRTAVEQISRRFDRIVDQHRQITACIAADGLTTSPHRVVHNDTKLSNVLLDPADDEAIAVLDFDLVMPGPLWHDVGDFLRSAAWHRGRRGPVVDVELQATLLRAWVGAAGESLDPAEVATLASAGPRLAFELGVRYLTDSLRAEPVLRVTESDGHLRRGLTNVKLASEMLEAYDALRFTADALVASR